MNSNSTPATASMTSKFKSPLLQKMFAERGGRLSPTAPSGRLSPTNVGGRVSPTPGGRLSPSPAPATVNSQGSSAGSSPVKETEQHSTTPEPLQFTDKPATRGPAGTTVVTTATTGSNGVSLIQASGGGATTDLMDGFSAQAPGGTGVSLMETSLTGSLEGAADGDNNIPFNGFDNSTSLIDTTR